MTANISKQVVDRLRLALVLSMSFILNSYGMWWGLPHRWNIDSRIMMPLRMIAEKTFFYCSADIYHPMFYKYFLMLCLAPYYLYLKLTGYDIQAVKAAASVSWLNMTRTVPEFVGGIMVIGIMSSVALGVLTVLMVYLTAKKMYGPRAGVFAALAMALNAGFIGSSHLIKNENLGLFLFACVLCLWVRVLTDGFSAARWYSAAFLAGLAMGTKLDTAVLLCGAFVMTFYLFTDGRFGFRRAAGITALAALFMFAGILFGYPRIVVPVRAEAGIVEGAARGFSLLFSVPTAGGAASHAKTVLLNIVASTGIPAFLFLLPGIGASFKRPAKPEILCHSLLMPYLFIAFFLYNYVSAKLLILALPLLSVFAGYGFDLFWAASGSKRLARGIVSAAILIYAVFYAVSADMVFAKEDTRYASTAWIKANIPEGSTIGVVQQPEVLFSSDLVERYKIYYHGQQIRYDNNPYRSVDEALQGRMNADFGRADYDYLVVSSWDFMKYESGEKDRMYERYPKDAGYSLVKEIRYNEDLISKPRPSYTCPAIFIFKKEAPQNG